MVCMPSWGYRHQQSVILLCALAVAYSMRACMGIAFVAMVDQGAANETSNYEVTGFFNALMLTPPYPKLKWSKPVQDSIAASFFWGYTSMQIPAGQLVHRFGSRRLFTAGFFVNCFAFLCLPHAAYYGGWIWTAILRTILGFGQAIVFPGMQHLFGKWAPLDERGRLTAITYAGIPLGSVLGLIITGFIEASPLGWPGIFRIYGILSGIVSGLVWWFMADTPALHPKISCTERRYIEVNLGVKEEDKKKGVLPVPWSKMLLSPALFAVLIANTGYAWGHVILYSEIPEFMDKIMRVDIKVNGLLTSISFIAMGLSSYISSWLTDQLINKNILSVTNTRKLSYSIGTTIPALGFITLAVMPQNIYIVVTVLPIMGAIRVMALSTCMVNQIDISPNFSGTLMSCCNFLANLGSSVMFMVAGYILTDVRSEYLWSCFFYVAAAVYLFSNIVFLIFGSGERAKWDDPDFNRTKDEELPMITKEVEPNQPSSNTKQA